MGTVVHVLANEKPTQNADNDPLDIFCDVFEQNRSFFRNASIRAAIAIGIFDLLTRPLNCEQLCAKLRLQPNRLRALLNVLRLEGVLEYQQEGGTYLARRTPERGPVLPEYGWGRLAQVIRTDRPLGEIESSEHMPDTNVRLHDHLFEIGYPAARRLWECAGISSGHLLDIGSGSGAYSAAFLEMHGDAKATLVDREEVLEMARYRLRNRANRARFEPRDAFKPVSVQYDVVLLANMLHLYGPSDCAKLIAAATQPLRQGGCLVVKDLWVQPDRSGPAVSVYFALNMALYTKAGHVYSVDQVCKWVKGTGLTDLRVFNTAHSLIVTAKKRSNERLQGRTDIQTFTKKVPM
ncbi:MAG: methyltransferase domain-containing protein [Deltaproteobacteria bacterium]|nr:methyltransferase domain-containing protein [Deltaproteobacteria bacterium]